MSSRMIALVLVMCAAPFVAAEQEAGATGLGVQVTTGGSVGAVYRGGAFEVGLTAQATLYDASAEGFSAPDLLRPGVHGSYLFGDRTASRRFGVGMEIFTGLGMAEVQWDEYLDLGPRVSVDQMIGVRTYVSALVYPFWITTRDVADVEDDWNLTATIPAGRLAVTFLF